MIENWKSRDEAKTNVLNMLANKDKIMGFGHAVYSIRDPRNAVIKEFAKELGEEYGDSTFYEVAEEVEQIMKDEKIFLLMQTFSMHLHIFIWAFQQNYLHQFL